MSNNYRFFSFMLSVTAKEAKWWGPILEALDGWKGEQPEDNGVPLDATERLVVDIFSDADGYVDAGFEWDISDEGIYFYGSEGPNLDGLAALIQKYLKEFKHDDRVVCIEYADTCDSMRPDNFGGGLAAITSRKIEWADTNQMAENARKNWARRKLSFDSPKKPRRPAKKRASRSR